MKHFTIKNTLQDDKGNKFIRLDLISTLLKLIIHTHLYPTHHCSKQWIKEKIAMFSSLKEYMPSCETLYKCYRTGRVEWVYSGLLYMFSVASEPHRQDTYTEFTSSKRKGKSKGLLHPLWMSQSDFIACVWTVISDHNIYYCRKIIFNKEISWFFIFLDRYTKI